MKILRQFTIGCMIIALLTGIIQACSEEPDCSMTARGWLQCNLYTLDENGIAVNDTLDSLTITAFGTDSVILNNQKEVCSLMLPLRYAVDSTVFVLKYSRTITDTIILYHTNTPYFLSMDCGYQMQQKVTSARFSRHELDSIYISYNETGINGRENIKIFY